MNARQAKAIAELRKGAQPEFDSATWSIIWADVERFYSWRKPEDMGNEDALKALFVHLVRRFDAGAVTT
ncbi:MAG TPA: hypothetical protein VEJ18_15415 [Planctomycetota bacterium]|nr:hypothetical protein [Planctomycetota bacterium]